MPPEPPRRAPKIFRGAARFEPANPLWQNPGSAPDLIIYACQILDQSFSTLTKIQPLQDKVLRVINFKANNSDIRDLYKNDQILKISDYIKMLNGLFVRDVLTRSTVPPFQNYFNKSENLHQHNTRHAKQNSVILTQRSTDFYGIKSIQHQSVLALSKLKKKPDRDLQQKSLLLIEF